MGFQDVWPTCRTFFSAGAHRRVLSVLSTCYVKSSLALLCRVLAICTRMENHCYFSRHAVFFIFLVNGTFFCVWRQGTPGLWYCFALNRKIIHRGKYWYASRLTCFKTLQVGRECNIYQLLIGRSFLEPAGPRVDPHARVPSSVFLRQQQ